MALHVFYIWFFFQLAVYIYMGLIEWFYNVFGIEPGYYSHGTGIFCLWGLLYALSFLLPGWLRGLGGESDSRSSTSNVPHQIILFGIFAGLVSMLWLVAGAGIYGSPVGHVFEYLGPELSRFSAIVRTPYWNDDTWIFLAFTAGPMAILPLSCLELYKPGWGARAMIAVPIVALIIAFSVGAFEHPRLASEFSIGFACLFIPLAGVGLFLLFRRDVKA